jgi:hypothetical protein
MGVAGSASCFGMSSVESCGSVIRDLLQAEYVVSVLTLLKQF